MAHRKRPLPQNSKLSEPSGRRLPTGQSRRGALAPKGFARIACLYAKAAGTNDRRLQWSDKASARLSVSGHRSYEFEISAHGGYRCYELHSHLYRDAVVPHPRCQHNSSVETVLACHGFPPPNEASHCGMG